MNHSCSSVVLLVSVFLVVGCDEPPVPQPIRPVLAMKIGDTTAISGRSLPGRAAAVDEVNLSFRVSGPLVELPLKVGQQVEQGDSLAQIDPTDFRVALEDAKARLDRAEQTLLGMKTGRPEEIRSAEEALRAAQAELENAVTERRRNERLVEDNAVSRSEYERSVADERIAESRVEAATQNLAQVKAGARVEDIAAKQAEIRSLEAAVENAENQLKYTTLRAPFDGTVAATFVENFQTVQANQVIVRLVNKSSVEVTVNLPEQSIHLIPYVHQVTCVFDAFPEKVYSGEITEVGAEATQATRTFPVTITVEQQFIDEGAIVLPGMACKVTGQVTLPDEGFVRGTEVPESAILDDGSGQFVWLVDESSNTVSRKPVRVGEMSSYGILVDGLEVGQWIAIAGVHSLREGQQVRLMSSTAE